MKKIMYTLIMLLTITSCDSWFDVDPKGEGLSGNKIFNNEASFRDYMNGIYAGLRTRNLYGGNLTLGEVEFLSQTYIPDSTREAWTKMDFESSHAKEIARKAYEGLYLAIYRCNDFIRQLRLHPEVKFVPGSREMHLAEATALRAFLHFELLQFFAPAYQVEPTFQRIVWMDDISSQGTPLTTSQLTERILKELNIAIGQLMRYDPICTGTGYDEQQLLGCSPEDRLWKLNAHAAEIIKARVLMTFHSKEKYREAYLLLKKFIDEERYEFVRTVAERDYSLSREFIFALPSDEQGFCALSEELFSPEKGAIQFASHIQPDNLGADDRRRNWIHKENSMRIKFAPSSKIDRWGTAPAIPMIKIGEVYLLAAEAAAQADGLLPEGINLYNKFMTQRNSPALHLPTNASHEELMQAIDRQYSYEFMGEGIRFKRGKRLDMTWTAYDGTHITRIGKKHLPIVQ